MATRHPATPRFFVPAVVTLLVLTLGALSCTGPTDEEIELQQYCELHEVWIATQGKHGWPDYKGTYNESCRDRHIIDAWAAKTHP